MRMICEVESCGEVLSDGTGSKGGPKLCPRCRSSSYTWRKADPDHIKERKQTLEFWSSRLDYFSAQVRRTVNNAKSRAATARANARTQLMRH